MKYVYYTTISVLLFAPSAAMASGVLPEADADELFISELARYEEFGDDVEFLDMRSEADSAVSEDIIASYGDTIEEEDMNESRGAGFDPVSIAQLEAVNSGNTVISDTTGYNMIGGDAFGNASGLINIIQNSGNGVVIQNSMIVNVNMQ
jgi:hypothetical protein